MIPKLSLVVFVILGIAVSQQAKPPVHRQMLRPDDDISYDHDETEEKLHDDEALNNQDLRIRVEDRLSLNFVRMMASVIASNPTMSRREISNVVDLMLSSINGQLDYSSVMDNMKQLSKLPTSRERLLSVLKLLKYNNKNSFNSGEYTHAQGRTAMELIEGVVTFMRDTDLGFLDDFFSGDLDLLEGLTDLVDRIFEEEEK